MLIQVHADNLGVRFLQKPSSRSVLGFTQDILPEKKGMGPYLLGNIDILLFFPAFFHPAHS